MNEPRLHESITRFIAGEATADDLARLRAELAERPERITDLFDAAEVELDLHHADAFAPAPTAGPAEVAAEAEAAESGTLPTVRRSSPFTLVRRFVMHPRTQLAAAVVALCVVSVMLLSPRTPQTFAADDIVMLPEGGRLDALDERGQSIGPCPLEHTDVTVDISGHFSRVTARQTYQNPYDQKIEAVYTFPLSHRGAVDRMTMTVGDRVVEGEVKEREQARRVYEAARDDGYVASLLEQERPNIFTQSVANIEPGERVVIEISYVETLESVDGTYQFQFPMVVAPRYIPGRPTEPTLALPDGVQPRRGVILQGPAELDADRSLAPSRLAALLDAAVPIQPPAHADQPHTLHRFTATYATGERETGKLFDDGTGHLNGRWFHFNVDALRRGDGFASDTDQVPDASRITPQPVRPEQRAGHDISLTVNLDTGGPGIEALDTPQHNVTTEVLETDDADRPRRVSLAFEDEREIPNRDFLLNWRQTGDAIQEATFTHTADADALGDFAGGYFTLMLQPPDRVADEDARPRELIFVLDNSGSMRGARLADRSALDAAKDVITRSIDTMRPNDRFNIVSFNNTLDVLWDEPRPNTEQNRRRAQRYVDDRQGGGGTEMRNAVLKALQAGPFATDGADRPLEPRELANLPADGREVRVQVSAEHLSEVDDDHWHLTAGDDLRLRLLLRPQVLEPADLPGDTLLDLHGEWQTHQGQRRLVVERAEPADADDPMRIVLFVTDGLVANDAVIIDAVRENAHRTRVFTIGMSRSPNRYLLDEMARVGRGAVDYALPDDEVDPIVQRFADRIATPVLTDISLDFSDGLEVFDVIPTGDLLPDLFDVQPLVIHGRYTEPGEGTLTIRGRTGAGPYQRTLDLELPENQPDHDVIATLWARSMIDEHTRSDNRDAIVELGEAFNIVSNHTSFVAVEKSRVTVGGKPVLVRVPIEFPEGMSWEGIFGSDGQPDVQPMLRRAADLRRDGLHAEAILVLDAILSTDADHEAARAMKQMIQDTAASELHSARRTHPGRFADAPAASPDHARIPADRARRGGRGGAAGGPAPARRLAESAAEPAEAPAQAHAEMRARAEADRDPSMRRSRLRSRDEAPAIAYEAESRPVSEFGADAGEPLPIELPNPVFTGTPQDIPEGARMQPPDGQPREPYIAAADLMNVARGKSVTASDEPLIGSLDLITDGDKEALDGRYAELPAGPQWVQLDLEDRHEIHAVLLWLNHMEARVYRGVVVQVSDDPDFERNVTTLFNNDHENSVGQGVGEDYQYFESFEGKLIEADRVVGRYVRVWSNGSTADDQNHFTEVEVWARKARPDAEDAADTEDAAEPGDPVAAALDRPVDELNTIARRVDLPTLHHLRDIHPDDWSEHRVLVAIRLSDFEQGRRQLDDAGFHAADSVERGSFVVGHLTLDRLDTIALLDTVRRIELIQ